MEMRRIMDSIKLNEYNSDDEESTNRYLAQMRAEREKRASQPQQSSGLDVDEIDMQTLELEGVDTRDYPDFVDAYAVAADYKDGRPLSDAELDELNDEHSDIIQSAAHDSFF